MKNQSLGSSILILATFGAMLVFTAPLRADDSNQAYDRLYGDEAKKLAPKDRPAFAERLLRAAAELDANSSSLAELLVVRATDIYLGSAAAKDFPAFADKLLKTATALKANSPLADVLMVKATDVYFRSATGEEKATLGETLIDQWISVGNDQLDSNSPADALKALGQASKIAAANKSNRSDDISMKIKVVQHRIDAERRFADLLAKLRAKPDDAALAKEAALLCVLELDRPADAAPFVAAIGDESWKTYVPLATKDPGGLDALVLKEIGGWYEGLAVKAGAAGKLVAYERAKTYFEAFLAKHTEKDEQYLAMKKDLDAVNKQLDAMSGMSLATAHKDVTISLGKNVAMKLVLIRGGKFMMGNPAVETGSAGPQHEVKITKPFYMGATVVTEAQWVAVMGMKGRATSEDPNDPVNNVSWDKSMEFCKKVSQMTGKLFRLPTEAEWEYACRAGTKTAYSFGDDVTDLGDYAWFKDNSDGKTHAVGLKKPNPWGLYDMHGLIWEWCYDWYDEGYYAHASKTDPTGPASGTKRVVRGNSRNFPAVRCRSYAREYNDSVGGGLIGFRVVMMAE